MEYRIGEFSKICRLSIKTLRYYHEQGILVPRSVDRFSGYRYYDAKTLEQAKVVRELRDLSFSIQEIKQVLAGEGDDGLTAGLLKAKAQEVEARIKRDRLIQQRLKTHLTFHEETKMERTGREATEKKLPEILIAGIRFKGRYEEVGPVFRKLYRQCGRWRNGKGFCLYHDDGYREHHADIEVCLPVKKAVTKPDIGSRTLAGGWALTLHHHGPYTIIGESYHKIIDALKTRSLSYHLPTREIYHRGPGLLFRGNPQKYVTEIQLLIKSDAPEKQNAELETQGAALRPRAIPSGT